MWFARTSFGWICYTAPMDTLFKKLGGMLSLALLAGLAQAETIEVTSDWILFPVKNGGAKMKLLVKDGAESLPPPRTSSSVPPQRPTGGRPGTCGICGASR